MKKTMLFLLLVTLLAVPAWGVDFAQEIVVASGGVYSRVNLNVFGVNQVDIVHKTTGTGSWYSCWDQNEFTVHNLATGIYSHEIMGITRYDDSIYIGHNSSKNAKVTVLPQCSSTWTEIDTGYDHIGYYTPYGGFAVDPCTGLGAMLFKDSNSDVIFIEEQPGGTWNKTVISPVSLCGTSYTYGAFPDLLYTADGVPIGALKSYDPVLGDEYSMCGPLTAGPLLTDPCDPGSDTYVPVTPVRSAYAYMHSDLVIADDGTLYLLDPYHVSVFEIYKSEDTGATWTLAGRCYMNGGYSTGFDDRLAVSADESTFAVVRYDTAGDPCDASATNSNIALLVSTDGYNWDTTWLPGADGTQAADVAFDELGNLYVGYEDTIADEAILLTTAAPVPVYDPIYQDAEITFTRTDVIASGDDVVNGAIKIDVSDDGIVDILWGNASTVGMYSCWDSGTVSTDTTSLGYMHAPMGISRDDGVVRVGMNSSKNLVELTRVDDNDWASVNLGTTLGYQTTGYTRPSGGYDVNPLTGRGAFLFLWKDPCNPSPYHVTYAYQTDSSGNWDHYIIDESGDGSYGRDATLIFDSDGTPYGEFRYSNGTGRGMQAGEITGPGPLEKMGSTNSYQYSDMALSPLGTLYALVHCYHSGSYDRSYLFKGIDGAACNWTSLPWMEGMVYQSSSYMDTSMAVAPDESLLAVLMNRSETVDDPLADPANQLVLYTSIDDGTTWEKQWLPGGCYQEADLGFDADGDLYVCYYDAVSDQILLLSTLPLDKPACWNATQCYGDSDGSGEVTTADWPAFRDSFGADYPEVDYNPCADYDRDGDVDTADWPAFRANFGAGSLPADCVGGTWPPLL